MGSSVPQWAREQYGDDADAIRAAVWWSLEDTQEATLDVRAAARSRYGFAPGGARMTNQFERLVERILDLRVEGTEIVKTGTWYKLPLVHNTLLFPVCTEVDGTEPPSHWPRNRELSGLVKEIFAATSPTTKLWVADPLPDLEASELVLRPSLAELAERDPRPHLVLVVYEMDRSGLKRAWWGMVELLDEMGTLGWLTERSLLTAPERTPLFAVSDLNADDDRFDSGDLPEVPMAGRSDEERKLGLPPTTEAAEETEDDSAESDED
ncbi:hypothetical protein JL475_28160 [Streptomyces sp. M2CJ-2]|uniref:hypothetical protein n=1 Tax=Streptomyces sp. M2CJ-2 TaxID=2803948 RepID=UPI001928E41E|nr:hypothetical protein [Streptomyces sp. M2CJ-2]MBL3669788.1 hypothetical protein [Streptomyces sp. M2CJ-2]